MVKNKQKYHLFIQKTYKKTFYHVIFTILLLRLRKELLARNFSCGLRKIRPSESNAVTSR